MDYLTLVTGLCGGLGLFLYGMHIMATGLQKAAGGKLKKILEMLTKNRVIGIILGALVTAVIQSSSATTVMVVGFVNAGLMDLTQAVSIIMGANIGTTITVWLVSSAEFLKLEVIAPMAVFVGTVLTIFSDRAKNKQLGEIIIGFGVLFIGIQLMSTSVEPLSHLEGFKLAFQQFGKNPVLGVIVGMVVTAVIQSSAASLGILIALTVNGLVTWDAAVYIIMGQNIGTCATALLSSLGASKNAKGAAYIHLLFNVIGSVIFSFLAFIFFKLNPAIGNTMITPIQISILHSGFNIANTVVMFPFAGALVKIAEFMCRAGKTTEDEEGQVLHLDDRILNSPSIAIASCIKEIVHLGNMANKNLLLAFDTIVSRDPDSIEKIYQREEKIDNLTKAITQYMVKLCNTNMSTAENNYVTGLFHVVHDMERIGDHCENLAEFTETLIEDDMEFSEAAVDELKNIFNETEKCVRNSIIALEDNDVDFAEKVVKEEERVDGLEKSLRQLHIDRLSANLCSPLVGVVYLDVLTNVERISDLALNVAEAVIKNRSSIKE